MKQSDQRPDDMMLPDELHPIAGAVQKAAQAIVLRRAFLDDLDAQVQRDATAHIVSLPIMKGATDETAFTVPFIDYEEAMRTGDRPVPAANHPAIGMPPPRSARRFGRRGFLVASAAAAASVGFVLSQRQTALLPDTTATQQAGRVLISTQMVAAAPPGTPATNTTAQPSNLDFADGLVGWRLWGSNPSDYTIGIDPNMTQHGTASAYLGSSVPDPQGFGTLARTFTPDPYRGTRLRMRGMVKADAVDNWAGLWMRVDGGQKQILSFDNMQGRPITGTRDWQPNDIVLDVPQESALLAFGILLAGKGRVWFSDVTFETVGQDVPTTDAMALPNQMQGLDFEAGMTGWYLAGSQPQDYRIGTDTTTPHGGKASGYLQARSDPHGGFGTLMQGVKADPYRGTRVRMSGWAKANGVTDWAGLWMRVDGPDTRKTQRSLSFDNMENRPIKGTSGWTRYEIVLDVPAESVEIAFGILLQGGGEVWLDDVQFAKVGNTIPTTNRI